MGYRSGRTRTLIAVDDTDSLQRGGTGRTARAIAELVDDRWTVRGVTRHQLAVLPDIDYTRKNSTNVVHLQEAVTEPELLAEQLCQWLQDAVEPRAGPGLCIAAPEAVRSAMLGHEAQTRVVTRQETRDAAAAAGVILRHACTDDGGTVGAFAGVCLAASADDGRFVKIGTVRDISGAVTVADIHAAGMDEVRTIDDEKISRGTIIGERFRPAFRRGRCVLYCRPAADGNWKPVKGWPEKQTGG